VVQKGKGWMILWSWHGFCMSLGKLPKIRFSAEYLGVSMHASLHSDLVFQRELVHTKLCD